MVFHPYINHDLDVAVFLKENGYEWRAMRNGEKGISPIGIIFQDHQVIIFQDLDGDGKLVKYGS